MRITTASSNAQDEIRGRQRRYLFSMLIRTAYVGGGTIGYTLGALFIVLGTARLYLLSRT